MSVSSPGQKTYRAIVPRVFLYDEDPSDKKEDMDFTQQPA